MKDLSKILVGVSVKKKINKIPKQINKIVFDSRKVEEGDVFFAVRGVNVDGHKFIDKAVEKGASSIICEALPENLKQQVHYIQVENSAKTLGQAASNFYGNPSHSLKLVGVTGTNGKTTTATLLYRLFSDLGYKVGLLSTVENKIGQKTIAATHTTPDAIRLNQLLALIREEGCDYVFMEVSSHAVHQERIAGLKFVGGIFTNITHDHIDYHKTFAAYIEAKKAFFDGLTNDAFALSNIDDKRGTVMLQNTKAKKYFYGLKKVADFKTKILDNSITGLHLDLGGTDFFTRLIGEFNAYNILTVYAVAKLLGVEELELLKTLSQLQTAEGRFECLTFTKENIIGIVDYAHTPDALEKVLKTIEQLKSKNTTVITVVGCGGDRDKAKRPLMAEIACDYSDQVILTSDNPRTEQPERIIQDMEKGIPIEAQRKVLSITNRKQGIKTACSLAKSGDIILVAGKGHEKYQEINGVKHHFDDKEILRKFLE